MSIPTFTPGYPPDGFSLGQTKATIRDNIDGTFDTLAVDHIDNNGQPGGKHAGYHTVIHSVPQTVVNTVVGYSQLFTGIPGSCTINGGATTAVPPDGQPQWFDLAPDGSIYQLTGAVKSTSGYAWMGGMLVQWKFKDLGGTWPSSSQTVNFNVTFPHACLMVLLTLVSNSSGSLTNGDVFVVKNSLTTTGFDYFNNISSGASTQGFNWVAIGY
jgi:hypothetical protein